MTEIAKRFLEQMEAEADLRRRDEVLLALWRTRESAMALGNPPPTRESICDVIWERFQVRIAPDHLRVYVQHAREREQRRKSLATEEG